MESHTPTPVKSSERTIAGVDRTVARAGVGFVPDQDPDRANCYERGVRDNKGLPPHDAAGHATLRFTARFGVLCLTRKPVLLTRIPQGAPLGAAGASDQDK
jgi:hypothetical protein